MGCLTARAPSFRAAIVGEASRFGVALAIVVGEAVSESGGTDVGLAAVSGIFQLRLNLDIHDAGGLTPRRSHFSRSVSPYRPLIMLELPVPIH